MKQMEMLRARVKIEYRNNRIMRHCADVKSTDHSDTSVLVINNSRLQILRVTPRPVLRMRQARISLNCLETQRFIT